MSDIQDLKIAEAGSGEMSGGFNDASKRAEHVAVIEIVEPKTEYPVGVEASLTINVRCPEGCDLGGGRILVGNEDDQIIAEQIITDFAEGQGQNTSGSFPVAIPTEPGEYSWTIVFFPDGNVDERIGDDDVCEDAVGEELVSKKLVREEAADDNSIAGANDTHAIVQAEYRFKANKHVTGMAVHREYQPVEAGAEYSVLVSVECLAGCVLSGQKIQVHLGDELLTTAELGQPENEQTKLCQATITLVAPQELGVYELSFSVEPSDLGLAHTANECKHYLTTKSPSTCLLELSVVDIDLDKPLANTSLSLQPLGGYPSWWETNEDGKAFIETVWGEHTLTASCDNYEFVTEAIALPDGQKTVKYRLALKYHPPLFA